KRGPSSRRRSKRRGMLSAQAVESSASYSWVAPSGRTSSTARASSDSSHDGIPTWRSSCATSRRRSSYPPWRPNTTTAAILAPPVLSKVLMSERLLSEHLVVAFPQGHRLKNYDRVPWSTLAGQPYVLCSRRRAPAFEAVVAHACQEAGLTLKVQYEVEHPQT